MSLISFLDCIHTWFKENELWAIIKVSCSPLTLQRRMLQPESFFGPASVTTGWIPFFGDDFFFFPLHKKHIECSHCTSLAVLGQNLTCEMLTPKTDVFSVSLCFKGVLVLSVLQFDRIHFHPFCKSWILLFLMHKGDKLLLLLSTTLKLDLLLMQVFAWLRCLILWSSIALH